VLKPILGNPTDSLIADAWLALRNRMQPSKILRTAYKFVPLALVSHFLDINGCFSPMKMEPSEPS